MSALPLGPAVDDTPRPLPACGSCRPTCDAPDAASKSPAEALDAPSERMHRNHPLVKGRSRDAARHAIIASERPSVPEARAVRLDDAKFGERGQRKRPRAIIRPQHGRAR